MMSTKAMSPEVHVDQVPRNTSAISSSRAIGFLLVCLSPILIAWHLMGLVSALALENDTYTHIPLIPLVSLFLIYTNRKAILSQVSDRGKLGGVLLLFAGVLAIV